MPSVRQQWSITAIPGSTAASPARKGTTSRNPARTTLTANQTFTGMPATSTPHTGFTTHAADPRLLGVPCALQFRSNQGNLTKEDIWSFQVDHNLGGNDRIFVQVQRDNGTQPTYTDPINPIFNIPSQQPAMNGQISENHRFS